MSFDGELEPALTVAVLHIQAFRIHSRPLFLVSTREQKQTSVHCVSVGPRIRAATTP